MAFVQITDPDKAMELYCAGLLWEQSEECPPEVANGWYREEGDTYGYVSGIRRAIEARNSWKFYILLED